MEPRRVFLHRLSGLTALALCSAGLAVRARAAAPLLVVAPNNAVAALAAAVGGVHVSVSVDAGVAATAIRVGDKDVPVAAGIVLKGKGPEQGRFLDDARNAPRVAGQIRTALQAADEANAADYAARHKEWSKAFVRKILGWQARLQRGPHKGQRINPKGRIYLLEWAGIVADAKGAALPALAKLPAGPASPTAAAYETYVGALVSALAP